LCDPRREPPAPGKPDPVGQLDAIAADGDRGELATGPLRDIQGAVRKGYDAMHEIKESLIGDPQGQLFFGEFGALRLQSHHRCVCLG
jgi:hypothetical protein